MTTKDGTIGKAVEILDLIAAQGGPVKFSELLELSSLPKATLYGYLRKLSNQNLLDYDDISKTYTFGLRVMGYAHVAWKSSSLAPIARSFAEDLAQQTKMTVHVGQLDNGYVLYVDKVSPLDNLNINSQVGKIAPAYCTGIGKAMLAFQDSDRLQLLLSQQSYYRHTEKTLTDASVLSEDLRNIRKTGLAVDNQEHEAGVICIATPILGSDGVALGGISLTTNVGVHRLTELKAFRPKLVKAAEDIGLEYEAWRYPHHG